ncbi:MAG TPA: hypothetical protein DEA08_38985, partial [Planctomycetes bacterium]|nr:hypothetical protein [Planctomycetota bacterium]
ERLAGLEPDLRLGRLEEQPHARVRDGLAAATLLGDALGDLDERISALEGQLEVQERDLSALAVQERQGVPSDARQRQVTLRLAGGGPVEALSLVYVVQAARWWPAYEARIEAGGQRARWALQAFVAQATGEDWREVELALSTADLVSDACLPELRSLRLGRAQPPKTKGYRPPPEGLDALFSAYEEALAQPTPRPAKPKPRPEAKPAPPPPPPNEVPMELDDLCEPAPEIAMDFAGAAPPGGPPLPAQAAPMRDKVAKSGRGALRSRSMSKKRAFADEEFAKEGLGGGGGLPPEPEPAPEALEPADAWLDFDALELRGRGAGSSQRGKLRRAPSESAPQGRVNDLSPPAYGRDPLSERGRFDHTYRALGLFDVPSQRSLTRVSLLDLEADLRQVLRTVPVEEEGAVYREAELTNPLEAPLLGGPADVYLDGSLLTTSPLSKVGRGGTIQLGLGTEDRVRVARNVKVEESSSGMISKTTRVVHHVTIELRSSLGVPARIVVVDRVPVVAEGEDDLEAQLLESSPAAEPYEQRERDARVKGGLRWEVELPAGGSQELRFSYALELPAKREVVGGNRRD